MISRGIRGAITVENNSVVSMKEATIELLSEMIERNSIALENISHVIFTVTKDLDAAFPAKFARDELGWVNIPMMCFNEADVQNAILACIRVLMVINTDKSQKEISHIYLKDAKKLRMDISQ